MKYYGKQIQEGISHKTCQVDKIQLKAAGVEEYNSVENITIESLQVEVH